MTRMADPRGTSMRRPRSRRLPIGLGLASWLIAASAVASAAADAPGGPEGGTSVEGLEERVSGLTAQVEGLTLERDRLRDLFVHLDDAYDSIDADRLLLTELRKEMPPERDAAERYLQRLRDLALRSDPAGLGLVSDRLAQAAPDFLDWRDTTFGTTTEASDSYISSGAAAFDEKLVEFRDAVLLTVANRLDGVLNMLDRAH